MKKKCHLRLPSSEAGASLQTPAINPRPESTRLKRAFRSAGYLSTWRCLASFADRHDEAKPLSILSANRRVRRCPVRRVPHAWPSGTDRSQESSLIGRERLRSVERVLRVKSIGCRSGFEQIGGLAKRYRTELILLHRSYPRLLHHSGWRFDSAWQFLIL
jgi:hypothetical protein